MASFHSIIHLFAGRERQEWRVSPEEVLPGEGHESERNNILQRVHLIKRDFGWPLSLLEKAVE